MLNEKRDKILFIDDEQSSHTIMQMIIPSFTSCTLLIPKNEDQALELARKYVDEIAIVFCDILLPTLDGYDLHRYLDEILDFNKVKFYFQSGVSAPDVREDFLNSGIEFIPKPYKHTTIKKIVENNIHSKFLK